YREDLYGPIDATDDFEASFEDIVNKYNANAKVADEGLTAIKDAILGLEPAVKGVDEAMASAAATKADVDAAGAADKLFLLPSLFGGLLAAAAAALADLKKRHSQD